jgi:hypothetical protein
MTTSKSVSAMLNSERRMFPKVKDLMNSNTSTEFGKGDDSERVVSTISRKRRNTMKKLLLGILAAGVLCALAAPASAQCPAAGATPAGCNWIITVNPGLGITVTTGSATPDVMIDSATHPSNPDDVMVGIINSSGVSLASLTLMGSTTMFGFDGDGACSNYSPVASPAACTGFTNEYFPAGITDSLVNGGQTSGQINFTGNLANGAQTWISLENFGTVTGHGNAPQVTPEPGTLGLVGSSLLGLAGILRRRLLPSSR